MLNRLLVAVPLMVLSPAEAGKEAKTGSPYLVPELGLEMAWIPPGEFLMGSPEDEPHRDADEGPVTRVVFTRGFWLGKHEVTQDQWRSLMETDPSHFRDDGADRPVESVTWAQAMEFCRRLTERERAAGRLGAGMRFTLPTEPQWEYAGRAGSTAPFHGEPGLIGWFAENSAGRTHPVGQKQPNAWGLHDVHGNVWEWCRNPAPPEGTAVLPGGVVIDWEGPASGANRPKRGGGWRNVERGCRVANRTVDPPDYRHNNIGFRVALIADVPSPR